MWNSGYTGITKILRVIKQFYKENKMDYQRIESKLDKVADDINGIKVTLAAQHVTLDEHIKRTAQLENRVDPIEKHSNMWIGALKFLAVASLVVSILSYFNK